MFYRRKLSISERMYLSCIDLFPPLCVQMVIEGKGNFPFELFKKALELASEVNFGTRLTLKIFSKGYYWVDSGINPPVSIIEDTEWSGFEFKEKEYLHKKLDFVKGPTSEVFIIPGEITRVIFRSLHAVMDAGGLLFWVEDVFRALKGETPIGTNSWINDFELLKSYKVKGFRRNIPFNCSSPFEKFDNPQKGYIWMRKRISGNYPHLVAQLAYLTASESSKHNKTNSRFMIPTDLRRIEDDLHSTGNLSNPLFVDVNFEESWQFVYKDILEQLKINNQLKTGISEFLFNYIPLSLIKIIFKQFSGLQFKRSKHLVSGVISNIGNINPQNFSTSDFSVESAFVLPIDIPGSPLTIVTTETKNVLELLISVPKILANDEMVKLFLEFLENGLISLNNLNTETYEINSNTNTNIISEEEKNRILYEFNDTFSKYPSNKTIHQLFEEQVFKNPDSIALIFENKTMTYSELNSKANFFAKILKQKGVKPDSIVALIVERSFEMIIGILSILKAGGAYLLIETNLPDERIRFMLNDADVKIILAQKQFLEKFPDIDTINLNDQNINVENSFNSDNINKVSDLVYIIYTSGSTGTPKGIMIEHKTLTNLIYFELNNTNIDLSSGVLQFANIAFDVCFQEIFSALLTGKKLFLINESMKTNVIKLFDFISKNEIKTIFLPTFFFMRVFNEDNFLITFPKSLKHIVVAGEKLRLTDKIVKFISNNKIYLHNHYGPSETHVVTSFTSFSSGISESIGKPISNTQIYILDKKNKICSVEAIGELCISGTGLARGYLNNSNLTKEKFVINPFTSELMYRTGDLARWLADGNIEYIGRIDNQVKFRGYRIELSEIENILFKYSNIDSCVVTIKEKIDSGDEKKQFLVAYYVANDIKDNIDFHKFLEVKLPHYMIPTHFVKIPFIPLTLNGKIDKKSLLFPESIFHGENFIYKEKEKTILKLINIVSEVLFIDKSKINPYVSLFEYGLDSLYLVVIFSRIENDILLKNDDDFLFENISTFLQEPTIFKLYDYIQKKI